MGVSGQGGAWSGGGWAGLAGQDRVGVGWPGGQGGWAGWEEGGGR